MASRANPIETRRPAPRLYLMTPPVGDPAGFADALAAALGATDIAAVCLRLAATDDRTLSNRIKALAPVVQDKGAALLLAGHAEFVARTGADGAHITGIEAFQAALATLKPDRIAGCCGLETRHDAMLGCRIRRRLRHVRRTRRSRIAAVLRRHCRSHRVVGGGVRGPLRRLCRQPRRGGATGRRRRRLRCRRRLGLQRCPRPAATVADAARRLAAGHVALAEGVA